MVLKTQAKKARIKIPGWKFRSGYKQNKAKLVWIYDREERRYNYKSNKIKIWPQKTIIAIKDHKRPKKAIKGHTRPYKTRIGHTKLYTAIFSLAIFFVFFVTFCAHVSTPITRTRTATKLLLGPLSGARGQKQANFNFRQLIEEQKWIWRKQWSRWSQTSKW